MSILTNFYKWTRQNFKIWINSVVIEVLIDTGTDITTISPESWHQNFFLQYVNVKFLGIGTLSQIKHSMRKVECIRLEGKRGIWKPYVANVTMNLWEGDLLHQSITQINIPPLIETDYKLTYVSGKKY